MLTNEQIEKILENKLISLGKIGGVVGGVIRGGIFGALGGYIGGASGARIGSRLISVDHKNSSIIIQNQNQIPGLVKKYFDNSLIHEEIGDDIYYAVGIKGSGFFNLNPCILEMSSRQTNFEIVAHAKEGLIKQKTCLKAISTLKEYLLSN